MKVILYSDLLMFPETNKWRQSTLPQLRVFRRQRNTQRFYFTYSLLWIATRDTSYLTLRSPVKLDRTELLEDDLPDGRLWMSAGRSPPSKRTGVLGFLLHHRGRRDYLFNCLNELCSIHSISYRRRSPRPDPPHFQMKTMEARSLRARACGATFWPRPQTGNRSFFCFLVLDN